MFPQGAPPSTALQMNRSFGVPIPEGVAPETVLAVHPTQLYETALGFLMFLVLWRLRDHKHAEGWLFGVYCVLAGAERFVIEFFRAKDDRFFGPLTAAQVIGLTIMAIGVVVMQLRARTGPGRPGIHASPATT
jgi:phosphatidylglycerol:prolipoprotein diacylglycerol transferase